MRQPVAGVDGLIAQPAGVDVRAARDVKGATHEPPDTGPLGLAVGVGQSSTDSGPTDQFGHDLVDALSLFCCDELEALGVFSLDADHDRHFPPEPASTTCT